MIIARWDTFIIGTVIILATNIILHARNQSGIYREKSKLGLTSLVLSIWLVGVIVLYRDRFLGSWIGQWEWNGSTDYYSLLGLSATVFILILSFRTLQINDMKRLEDQLTFSLTRKVEVIEWNTEKFEELKEVITVMDKSKPGKKLDDSKEELRQYFRNKDGLEKMELAKILEEIDYLVHSKSRARTITEPLVLCSFAVITAIISLLTRPCFIEWNALINDIFSILFVSTIIYLTINLVDQKRERSQPIIDIKSSETSNSWVDISLPIGVCTFLLLTFCALLYGKWLGDWSWTSELVSQTIKACVG